jgi:hypothetical protein
MDGWINLSALGKIIGLGLLFGAVLPAVFAVGLRGLSVARPELATGGAAAASNAGAWGYVVAVVCFLVVLAAIGAGIFIVVDGA